MKCGYCAVCTNCAADNQNRLLSPVLSITALLNKLHLAHAHATVSRETQPLPDKT